MPRQLRLSVLAFVLTLLVGCAAVESETAATSTESLAGRWTYVEAGETVELELRQEAVSGNVTGTLAMFGKTAPIEGKVEDAMLLIRSVGSVTAAAENATIVGRLQDGVLMLTIVQPGSGPVVLPLERQSVAPQTAGPAPTAALPREAPPVEDAHAPPIGTDQAKAADFAGRWESVSDDGTEIEALELTVSGDEVSGTLVSVERGYFSGRDKVTAETEVRGRIRNGALALQAWNSERGPTAAVEGLAARRGQFLVLRIGTGESSFGRPGVALVETATDSAEALSLARAITGRIYSAGSETSGRGGFVGGRIRIALCADGSMAYDASDIASVPGAAPDAGVDMGATRTRRGTWDIVLRAGAPVVRAQWQGSGTSYSLTEYFQFRASAGQSAVIDGRELPVTGGC